MKVPQRGEVWLVDLGMAAKVRPCLVLSVPTSESDRSLVTLVPHTTSLRNSPEALILAPLVRRVRPLPRGGRNIPKLKFASAAT